MNDISPAQRALLNYLDGNNVQVRRRNRPSSITYKVCRDNGWIEPMPEFPHYRVTDLGRRMLDTPSTAAPTLIQAQLIAFFAGGPRPVGRINTTTYQICRDNGWIKETREHPYHEATPAGLAAIGVTAKPKEDTVTTEPASDEPAPISPLMVQLLEANHRHATATTNALIDNYRERAEKAEATLHAIRDGVMTLYGGDYQPSARVVRLALFPDDDKINKYRRQQDD